MDVVQDFNRKPENKNWLKSIFGLLCLRKYLETLTDEEIKVFHQLMSQECGSDPCGNNCDFSKWKPKDQPIPLFDCEVCSTWRDEILAHHSNPKGKVMWKNSKPHLWSQDQWEVAKVYMPNGHKDHNSVGDFDIAALLCLMTQCKHFKKFELGTLCQEVANVRNSTMHSPDYQLKQEDLHNYLGQIRKLSEVLAEHYPNFGRLSQDIDEIQHLDFILTLPAQDYQSQNEKELEQKLFATQLELKQARSDHEKEIEALHRSYGEKLQKIIDLRDRMIEAMNTAAEQEVIQIIGMKMRKTGEMVQQGLLVVKQEAGASFWMKMREFLRDPAHAPFWMKTEKIPGEMAQLKNSAVDQEDIDDVGMEMRKTGEMVQQGILVVKQEANEPFWMKMTKFLRDPAVKQKVIDYIGMKMRKTGEMVQQEEVSERSVRGTKTQGKDASEGNVDAPTDWF